MFTAVSFVWNRSGWRIRNHLVSLNYQSHPFSEIILVDFSTNKKDRDENAVLCHLFNATHLHHSINVWSKSLAINWGIKEATTKYILTTDIDQVFHKDLLKEAEEKLQNGIFLEAHTWMTPKNYLLLKDHDLEEAWEEILGLCKKEGLLNFKGAPIHIFEREWLVKVHGFNEEYKYWGAMDNEISLRAKWDGLGVIKLSPDLSFHQFHSREKGKIDSMFHNRKIFWPLVRERKIIVNGPDWGQVKNRT